MQYNLPSFRPPKDSSIILIPDFKPFIKHSVTFFGSRCKITTYYFHKMKVKQKKCKLFIYLMHLRYFFRKLISVPLRTEDFEISSLFE